MIGTFARATTLVALLGVGAAAAAPSFAADAARPADPGSASARAAKHLELERSAPEADAVVTSSPEAIRLWFTQSPQIRGTSVRLVPAGGEPLPTGDAKLDEANDKLVIAGIDAAIADGEYTVMWRAMAADGHVVRGEFRFTVAAAR